MLANLKKNAFINFDMKYFLYLILIVILWVITFPTLENPYSPETSLFLVNNFTFQKG